MKLFPCVKFTAYTAKAKLQVSQNKRLFWARKRWQTRQTQMHIKDKICYNKKWWIDRTMTN